MFGPKISGNLNTLAYFSVQVKQSLSQLAVIRDDAMDVTHVRFTMQRCATSELQSRDSIDQLFNIIRARLPRNRSGKLLT
jgi:hypothetical protein